MCMTLPQKMLIIKDMTFILPEGFNGNLIDALDEYAKYLKNNKQNERNVDKDNVFSTTEVILANRGDGKSCIMYAIVELDQSGDLKVLESSNII